MDAVLTFHSLDDSGSVLSFPPDRFRRLVDDLVASDVAFVSPAELLEPPADHRHRVALTFDDGFASVYDIALPVLRDLELPATVYVVTDFVGGDNRWPTQPPDAPVFDLMGWPQLAEWSEAGLGIGCHTATHPFLDRPRSDAEWDRELHGARDRLHAELGAEASSFAYPYGRTCDDAVRRLHGTYRTAVTTRMRYLSAGDEPLLLPRIDSYYLQQGPRGLFDPLPRAYLAVRSALRSVRGQ